MNDDGSKTDRDIEGYYNHYSVKFTYTSQVVENETVSETIRLTFGLKTMATALYNNETKCAVADMNDMLGNIYIYNGFDQSSFKESQYEVHLIRPDFTFALLGEAFVEGNLMVFDWRVKDRINVCLSNIHEIRFVKTLI